jgi:hypothetical protein
MSRKCNPAGKRNGIAIGKKGNTGVRCQVSEELRKKIEELRN